MKDPIDPLYRAMSAVESRPAGFIISGQILSFVLIVSCVAVTSVLVLLFPNLDFASVMLWSVGISAAIYFSYSFTRDFFSATTASSEAAARAEDEKYG